MGEVDADDDDDDAEEELTILTEPPKVELSNEEKKQWFRKPTSPDLTPYQLSTNFAKFSVPDKDEGFEEIKFEWYKGDRCKEYVGQWIRDRKTTTRIENIQPSDGFSTKWKDWQKLLQTWHSKQNSYKSAVAKKAADKAAKAAANEAKRKLKVAEKKRKEEEAKKKAEIEAKLKADAEAK